MFDVYESIISFTNEYAMFLSDPVKHVFRSFGAWAAFTDVPPKELPKKREAYFLATYPGRGDALSRLLNLEDEMEKEATIRFLCLADHIFDKLPELTTAADDIEKSMANKLEDRNLLSRLIGRTVGDTKIKIHVSQMEPRAISVHHLNQLGIFLSVGADIDLDNYMSISDEALLTVFKALADHSRLRIVQALLNNNMTTSALATRVNLTLSTVNHHLKQLVEANLVTLDAGSKAGKGASYTANKTLMRAFSEYSRTTLA